MKLNQIFGKPILDDPPAGQQIQKGKKPDADFKQRIGELLHKGLTTKALAEAGQTLDAEYCTYNGKQYTSPLKDSEGWNDPEKSGWRDGEGNKIAEKTLPIKIVQQMAPHKGIDKNSSKNDVTNAAIEANIEYLILHPDEPIHLEMFLNMSDEEVQNCINNINQRKEQYLAEHNYASEEEARADLIAQGVDKVNTCSWPFAALNWK